MDKAIIKAQPHGLTPEEAFLLGILAGDGHVRDGDRPQPGPRGGVTSYYRVEVACGLDRWMAERCVELFDVIYGVKARLVIIPPDGVDRKHENYLAQCSLSEVAKDIASYGSFGVYKWRVPEKVLAASPEIRSRWLRGFFEADGGVRFKSETSTRLVHAVSVCLEGLDQVSGMLTVLGIQHSVRVLHGDDLQDARERWRDYSFKEAHIITITYHEDLARFRNLVGFESPRKRALLDEALTSYKRLPLRAEEVAQHEEEISRRRRAGETHAEIAESLGLLRETVAHCCYRLGVEPEGREGNAAGGARSIGVGPLERLLPQILELREQGKKDGEIASLLGLGKATQVRNVIVRARRKGRVAPVTTQLERLLPEILRLRGEGKTAREVAGILGFSADQNGACRVLSLVSKAKKIGALVDGQVVGEAFNVHRVGRKPPKAQVVRGPTRWLLTDKGDPAARALVDGESFGGGVPHYSRQTPGAPQFTRNGQNLVFITADERAVWVTFRPTPGKAERFDGLDAWECALFRNEGSAGVKSSDLIREAVELSAAVWGTVPKDGFITYIDPSRVKTGQAAGGVVGYCYRRAGWKHVDMRPDGRLMFRAPVPARPRSMKNWAWHDDRGGKLRAELGGQVRRRAVRGSVPALVPQIIELRKKGVEIKDIAAKFGLAKGTVSKAIKDAGLSKKFKRVGYAERLLPQILELKADGFTHEQIAAKLGITSHQTVNDVLVEARKRGLASGADDQTVTPEPHDSIESPAADRRETPHECGETQRSPGGDSS